MGLVWVVIGLGGVPSRLLIGGPVFHLKKPDAGAGMSSGEVSTKLYRLPGPGNADKSIN
ncbi:MAG: hypothetical protein KAW12_11100 [Candidatus Aminicenantes bacterium]|nr:hypothetical protein [Candidatus Aminicenantes bacterium]